MPCELFLTTRQRTKINVFDNNMSTDKKLNKAQISKIIQSWGSFQFWFNFGYWLGNLAKKVLTNVAIPFTRDNLSGLISNIALNAIHKFERKMFGKGAVRAVKEFTLFISNEDM